MRRVRQALLIIMGVWCLGGAVIHLNSDNSNWGAPALSVLVGVAAIFGAFRFKD
jgi:hypothetical protein